MSDKKSADISELSYEAARDELQKVVAELEAGSVTLEASMALWERAEALAAHCEAQLTGARKKLDDVIAKKEK
jgi:exodeoxyribonuclease VII small subunit